MEFRIRPIGYIYTQQEKYSIQLDRKFIPGLKHIEGFSHLLIIWWAHLTGDTESRNRLVTKNLFRFAPGEVGVFASRTPERPNPLMISTIRVTNIDPETGTIVAPFIDAENETPVLDIKPYFPVERIRECKTPAYYEHWPKWAEDANQFNWKNEISFDNL